MPMPWNDKYPLLLTQPITGLTKRITALTPAYAIAALYLFHMLIYPPLSLTLPKPSTIIDDCGNFFRRLRMICSRHCIKPFLI